MPAGAWAGLPFSAQAQTRIDNGRDPDEADRAAIARQEAVVILGGGGRRHCHELGDVTDCRILLEPELAPLGIRLAVEKAQVEHVNRYVIGHYRLVFAGLGNTVEHAATAGDAGFDLLQPPGRALGIRCTPEYVLVDKVDELAVAQVRVLGHELRGTQEGFADLRLAQTFLCLMRTLRCQPASRDREWPLRNTIAPALIPAREQEPPNLLDFSASLPCPLGRQSVSNGWLVGW